MNKNDIEEIYRLTPMQEGMYFRQMMSDSDTEYVIQKGIRISGAPNKEYLVKSVHYLALLYPVLRTSFVMPKKDDRPWQVVLKNREIEIHFNDCKNSYPSEKEAVEAITAEDLKRGFDVVHDSLIRFTVSEIAQDNYYFLMTAHHIILDGWCIMILFNDVIKIYEMLEGQMDEAGILSYVNEKKKNLPPFSNYVKWIESKNKEEGLKYWKNVLDDYNDTVGFVKSKNVPNTQKNVDTVEVVYDSDVFQKLNDFASANRVSKSVVLETAWGVLLQKYSCKKDVVFGNVVSGRNNVGKGVNEAVGMYVNTVPVRVKNDNDTFLSMIKNVNAQAMGSNEYYYCSLADVQNATGNGQLFDTLFVHENYYVAEFEMSTKSGLSFTALKMREETNYPVTISVYTSENFSADVMFNRNEFDAEEIRQILVNYGFILSELMENADIPVSSIEMATKEEKLVLRQFNDTVSIYPNKDSVSRLFEQTVARTPDAIAVKANDKAITYDELNKKANRIADALIRNGVCVEDPILIIPDKSIDAIAALLGILKAGAAYVPVDSSYPCERIRVIEEDCNPKIILKNSHFSYENNSGLVFPFDDDFHEYSETNPSVEANGDNLAYVIYTSGTTGKPKGSMIMHKSISRLVLNTNYVTLDSETVVLQTGALAFDASTFEVWGSLLHGGTLCLAEQEILLDPQRLKQSILDNNVNAMWLTSSLFNQMEEQDTTIFAPLKYLLIGGERLSEAHVAHFKQEQPSVCLINGYGPTEGTTFTCCWTIPNDFDRIFIGYPIANTQVYVMQDGNLCARGMAGELFIGGDGVSRGYLNLPELTNSKFIKNPYGKGILYASGDMARWTLDGKVDYIGRMDQQVKIRGYRIEPEDVETSIEKIEDVKTAVVRADKNAKGELELNAWFVADRTFEAGELKNLLKTMLPAYMIPVRLMQIDSIPTTMNGKKNRRILQIMEEVHQEITLPSNETQQKLAAIFGRLLSINEVDVTTSFFDLGGHSLKAMSLINGIEVEFGKRLSLKDIFANSSILQIEKLLTEENVTEEYEMIPVAEKSDRYPMSSAQLRLYLINDMSKNDTLYNIPAFFEMQGEADYERANYVLNKLVERHEILRTEFVIEDGVPYQKILDKLTVSINTLEDEYRSLEDLADDFIQPFDYGKAPLFRMAIGKTRDSKKYLLFDISHLIFDGMSVVIFMKEFMALYEGRELSPLRVQYKDYGIWADGLDLQKQQEYWVKQFEDEIPVLNFPCDYQRPRYQEFSGKTITFEIPEEIRKQVVAAAHKYNTTEYTVLASVFALTVGKYSSQEDIVVGTPVSGRIHNDTETMLGNFVNTLAIRCKPENDLKFSAYMKRMTETITNAFDNQAFPFEKLVEVLNPPQDTSKNPIFDVMFVMQNNDSVEMKVDELSLHQVDVELNVSKFDFILTAWAVGEKYKFALEYSDSLFSDSSMKWFTRHFMNLLCATTSEADKPLKDYEMLDQEEKSLIIDHFNNTGTDYPRNASVKDLFKEQAKINPLKTAVEYEEEKITYEDLDKLSDSMAVLLQKYDVRPGDNVAILANKGIDMVAAIIAILKRGAAYVPIDTHYPADRMAFIVKDANAKLLLTCKADAQGIDGVPVVDVTNHSRQEETLEDVNVTGDVPAYVIYTSGTTGNPKGTVIENRSIIRLVKNTNFYPFSSDMVTLQTGSVAFDASTFEIWGTLLNGGKLCLAENDVLLSAAKLKEQINGHNVNTMWMTASLFNQIVEEDYSSLEQLKYLLIGGEKLSEYHVKKFRRNAPSVCLINGYGPTENTTFTTTYAIPRIINKIPIGYLISNTTGYVMRDGRLCGIGVPGELLIGGDGLTRGYLNRPELNEAKFIENPFCIGKLYKSGDLVKWNEDGSIDYLGRIDNQVKIRGFRIELEEVEKAILEINGVKEAAVIVDVYQNEKRLAAYYVAEDKISSGMIYRELEKVLPSYMIPSDYVQLERLPVTNNGKIAKNKLPKIEQRGIELTHEEPIGETEKLVAECISSVLGVAKIGRTDDFFQIGGHSLKAMLVINLIEEKCGVRISLMDFFKVPSVAGIAEVVDQFAKGYEEIPKLEKQEYYPLSPAQNRMYVLNRLSTDTLAYNMPLLFRMEGKLDRDRLDNAYALLGSQEEILRTRFILVNDEPVQVTDDVINGGIRYLDIQDDVDVMAFAQTLIKPFDLEKAPLFRLYVISKACGENYLFIDMHHIISDGASMGILVKEFIRLYEGGEKSEKRIFYKDFASWSRSRDLENQKEYWCQRFADEIPVLNFTTDFHRPSFQCFDGKTVSRQLDHALCAQVKNACQKFGMTEYMFFVASLGILLGRYCRQEDLVIGTSTAGRVHRDTHDCLGMFVNTLPLRIKPVKTSTLRDYFAEVKTTVIDALENQEYPFEEMVNVLAPNRDVSRNPIFDVLFVMQNNQIDEIKTEDFNCVQMALDLGIAKFDMTFVAEENKDGILLSLEYAVSLFRDEMMQLVLDHFVELIRSICGGSELTLNALDCMSDNERAMILEDFNEPDEAKPAYDSITDCFAEVVRLYSERIAVACQNAAITYQELDACSDRIASALKNLGVEKEDCVAIVPKKELSIVPTILGIIKSGAAYVPIDVNYPNERISLVLKDCEPKVVIYSNYVDAFDGYTALKLGDESWYGSEADGEAFTGPKLSQENLAYVIYTSGTTGRPKGSMIEHKSILRLVKKPNYVDLNEETVVLQTGALAFDASTLEIWGALLNGGKLCIADTDVLFDGELFKKTVLNYGVNTMWLTSSLFNQLEEQDCYIFENLKYLLIGGEKLSEKHVFDFRKKLPDVHLINGYGPTENTTFTTTYEINNYVNGAIPIGSHVNNTTIYVIEDGNLCGIGVPGELCTGGLGVSRGYLNRDDLNREKFIDNPFGEGKLYRTDDIVRWKTDGTLEYLGRRDDQVKIRGFRVETTEIEYVLLHVEGITHAVVCVEANDAGEKYLTAHFCADREMDVRALRRELAEHLPSYMIPSRMMQIEKMPLTINGKIDKRALPEIMIAQDEEIIQATNSVEEQVLSVIAEVLGTKSIGINSDFFEYGGDSIKAIRVVSRIRELGYNVSVKDIMTYKNVEEISKHVTRWMEQFSQEELTGEVEFLPIQKVFFDKQMPDYNYFNQAMMLESDVRFETEKLKKAFDALVKHHDMLRAVYVDGRQVIRSFDESNAYAVTVLEYPDDEIDDALKAKIASDCENVQRNVNIEEGPLTQVAVIRLREKDHLMIACHHLVIDGVSWRILLGDFVKAYEQVEKGEEVKLPLKASSYKDWVDKLREYGNDARFEQEKAYWNQINERVRECNERSSFKNLGDFKVNAYVLTPELSEMVLQKIHGTYNTNANDVLLTALAIALKQWDGQSSHAVTLESHGRNNIMDNVHVDRTVGWFTAIYPVIIQYCDDLKENVIQTKEMLRKIPSEGLGYGLCLLGGGNYENTEIAFNYLGEMDSDVAEDGWVHVSKLSTGRSVSPKNDSWQNFALNCMCVNKRLQIEVTYDASAYASERIDEFFDVYETALKEIADRCLGAEAEKTMSDFGVYDMSEDDAELLNSLL